MFFQYAAGRGIRAGEQRREILLHILLQEDKDIFYGERMGMPVGRGGILRIIGIVSRLCGLLFFHLQKFSAQRIKLCIQHFLNFFHRTVRTGGFLYQQRIVALLLGYLGSM